MTKVTAPQQVFQREVTEFDSEAEPYMRALATTGLGSQDREIDEGWTVKTSTSLRSLQERLTASMNAEKVGNKKNDYHEIHEGWCLGFSVVDPRLLQESLMASMNDEKGGKKKSGMKAKKDISSGPPSPPEIETPRRVTIGPPPNRLWPFIPPPNFGTVENGKIYRSAFPQDRNIEFCSKDLGIRTVLTLVDTDAPEGYEDWIYHSAIQHLKIEIGTNKDGQINTTADSLCEAVLVAMDPANYPLWIHCNQGRHRTGCVVACLRKVQRVPVEDIITEYIAYASPKQRPGDVELIRNFDPELVYLYAKNNSYLNFNLTRKDSTIGDVDSLAAALEAGGAALYGQEEEKEELVVDPGLGNSDGVAAGGDADVKSAPIAANADYDSWSPADGIWEERGLLSNVF